MSYENDIPLTYQSSILEEKKSINQKFTQDGEEIKINLISFSNDDEESVELLLALIKDFDNMVDTYDLFNTLTVTKVINWFRRCLSGTALEDWDLIRTNTLANTQSAFKKSKLELIEETIDEDTPENILEFLKRTKMPKSMTVKKWIKRMC